MPKAVWEAHALSTLLLFSSLPSGRPSIRTERALTLYHRLPQLCPHGRIILREDLNWNYRFHFYWVWLFTLQSHQRTPKSPSCEQSSLNESTSRPHLNQINDGTLLYIFGNWKGLGCMIFSISSFSVYLEIKVRKRKKRKKGREWRRDE